MNQTQKTSHKRILQADAAGTQAIFQAGTAGTQAIFQAGTAARFRYRLIRHITVPIRNELPLSLRCRLINPPQMSHYYLRGFPFVLPYQDIPAFVRDVSIAQPRLQQDGPFRVVN